MDRFYVSNIGDIKKMVLKEMHNVPYVGNSCYPKKITAVRK